MKAKAAKTILLLLTAFACFSLAPFGATKHGASPALETPSRRSRGAMFELSWREETKGSSHEVRVVLQDLAEVSQLRQD
jgi:hypothetical protein